MAISQSSTISTDDQTVQVDVMQVRNTSVPFMTRMEEFRRTGTSNQRTLIAGLDAYVANMAPRVAISAADGAKNQFQLWKLLELVLVKYPREEFQVLWNIVLLYFDYYGAQDQVFGARYVYRFAPDWSQSELDLRNFQKVINLATLTANPTTRVNNLRKVSFSIMMSDKFPQEAGQRLSQFYNK